MYDQPNDIIVPHPKKLLLEHAINELLNGQELEVMLQGFCSEGSVDDCWVEERDEKVFASWIESVHSGCRDMQYINNHEIELTYQNGRDRKSTRLNSSHTVISYAVFCLKKKK